MRKKELLAERGIYERDALARELAEARAETWQEKKAKEEREWSAAATRYRYLRLCGFDARNASTIRLRPRETVRGGRMIPGEVILVAVVLLVWRFIEWRSA